jgi:hypothetical protein
MLALLWGAGWVGYGMGFRMAAADWPDCTPERHVNCRMS